MGATASKQLCLPQHDADPQRRALEVVNARDEYRPCTDGPRGAPTKRVPAYPKPVPKCEDVTGDASDAIARLTGVLAKLKWRQARLTSAWWTWAQSGQHAVPFEKHAAVVAEDPPAIAKDHAWKDDYEWGYQRLNGLAPTLVRRCDRVPPTMAAQLAEDDGAALAGLLPDGETLASLIAAKRVFIVDHSDLEGCPVHEGRYLCPSRTLFLATGVNDSRAPPLEGETIPEGPLFRPIAIQLEPKASAPVITPVHPTIPGLWLAARLHATVPDAAVQIFFEHVVSMHLCNEAFWMCMCRTMADAHPLKQIMKPHMHVTLYIGEQFRETTYTNPTGSLPHLHACGVDGGYWIMEKKLETWKMTDHDQSRFYKERGTDELEGYTMRDDAKAHWDAIVRYCRRVVDITYPQQPYDILADSELQDFVHELRDVGRFNGVPGDANGGISKAQDVALLLAIPIFAGAVKHSQADNASHSYYGYAPNTPLSFMLPPPVSEVAIEAQVAAGGYTDRILADHLAQGGDAALQYALVMANRPLHPPTGRLDKFVSTVSANDSGSAEWPMAAHPAYAQAWQDWVADLRLLEQLIDERNETLQPRPYPYLKPSDMSNSIWY